MGTLRLKKVNICEGCGKQFHPHTGRRYSNKWCSRKCFYETKRVYETCKNCGKSFYHIRSKPRIFCSRKCWFEANGKTYHGQSTFKGEKHISGRGYVYIHIPDHPAVQGKPYKRIAEHRLVMEKFLGRYLHSWELVHHKNRNKQDNSLENLELWFTGHPNGNEVSEVYISEIIALQKRISQLESELAELK